MMEVDILRANMDGSIIDGILNVKDVFLSSYSRVMLCDCSVYRDLAASQHLLNIV